jgi:PAS domain-containing protein
MTIGTPPLHPVMVSPVGIVSTIIMIVLLLAATMILVIMLRKLLHNGAPPSGSELTTPRTDMESPTAFMTASMQGVIEKLRAQEKELARLHVLAQERAQESERMTEEVTRNMPTGLLLVSATGAISSTNPAAEAALGCRRCATAPTRKFSAKIPGWPKC